MHNTNEYQKTYISTNTTTTVFTGKGTLHAIVVNTGAAGSITLKDNGVTFAILKASVVENSYIYDCVISKDLSVVTAGSTDITVVWAQ